MKVAILIAIESYSDSSIPPIRFAQADAIGFAAALAEHGFGERDRVLLIDASATKTIVESRLRKAIAGLAPTDQLFFSYAGHGFSEAGRNYLACHDTQAADLTATSIPLDWLFGQLKQSGCQSIAMFLDACAGGLLATPAMRDIYGDLSHEELAQFFAGSERSVCFAACASGEESWRSGRLQHGVWMHHVVEAFDGRAPLALERRTRITSASLQSYLKKALPRTLRTEFTDKKVQTPTVFGATSGDALLADVGEILSRRKTAAKPNSGQVARVSLVRRKGADVRRLSGFRKGMHSIPSSITKASHAFVAGLAESDLREDLQRIHDELRSALKFKRADMQVAGPSDGAGSIITPYFTYSVNVGLNPAEPSEVLWRRQVSDIKEADQIFSAGFAAVFGELFDTVEFLPPGRIAIKELIDRIEHLDDDRLQVDYDHETTWCALKISGIAGTIRVTRDTFELVMNSPGPPQRLLKTYFDIQRALVDTHEIRLIPFA